MMLKISSATWPILGRDGCILSMMYPHLSQPHGTHDGIMINNAYIYTY